MSKILDPFVNLATWCKDIYERQKTFQTQLLQELKAMSAELDTLKAAATKLSADVSTVLTAYTAAKANEVPPAELTAITDTLTATSTAIDSALNPPAAS